MITIAIDPLPVICVLIGIVLGYVIKKYLRPDYVTEEGEPTQKPTGITQIIRKLQPHIVGRLKLNEEQQKILDDWIGIGEAIEGIPIVGGIIKKALS